MIQVGLMLMVKVIGIIVVSVVVWEFINFEISSSMMV